MVRLIPKANYWKSYDYFAPGCHRHCPYSNFSTEESCGHECDDIGEWARELAAAIRDWREGPGQEVKP